MHPLKVSIPGDFIDCQIYRGRLYLWTNNGCVKVYDWDKLISLTNAYQNNKLMMRIGFLEGNLLYKSGVSDLLDDIDFLSLAKTKLESLSEDEHQLSCLEIDQALLCNQDFPSNLEPIDTTIYRNSLYYITDSGLFECDVHFPKKYKTQLRNEKKLWDCPLFSLMANSFGQIALSAGDEGLFELNNYDAEYLENKPVNLSRDLSLSGNNKRMTGIPPIFQISKKHSTFANYNYANIYSSSSLDASYMALFEWIEHEDYTAKKTRKYLTDVNDVDIFNSNNQHHISWGNQGKLYLVSNNEIRIVRLHGSMRGLDKFDLFEEPKIVLHSWKGEVIAAGSAYFGVVIECENALVVLLSNGESYSIPGPITKWRVYPRSHNYENHLHVIFDDKITIYSFNNDYFVDQKSKDFGVEYKEKSQWFKWQQHESQS